MGDVREKQPGIAALTQFAVDPAAHVHLNGEGKGALVDQCGPHDGKAVQALAPVPLVVPHLDAPGRHVIENGVAKDIVLRLLRGHIAAFPADDDGQFHLVVQTGVQIQMTVNRGVMGRHDVGALGEIDAVLMGDLTHCGLALL